MVDTSHTNMLNIIGQDIPLKKEASTNGGEYAGPCPYCGGEDRFRVWPNQDRPRFWCRQCNRSGDVITYVQERDNLTFVEACQVLHIEIDSHSPRRQHVNQSITPELKYLDHDKPALTDAQWQEKAQWFVGICQEKLFSREGEDALQYLHQRGLSSATIEQYSLGYCSSSHHQNWGNTKGIYLPCGIVIPSWIDGQIRTVKFRVPEGEPKYIAATGGAGGLYMADNLQLGCTVIMAEGEFDAHILAEHVQIDGVAPIATGGSNNNQTMDAVVELMALADQILLAFDQDEAGVNAALWWQNELGDKASIMQLSHHDVTDMYLAGIDLNQWVQDALG